MTLFFLLKYGLTGPLPSVGLKSVKGLRCPAFFPFKTTDSSNLAFDLANLLGSGAGIISAALQSSGIKQISGAIALILTNQTKQKIELDQSTGTKHLEPIKTFRIKCIIRGLRKVT